jgi:hypothetical protein
MDIDLGKTEHTDDPSYCFDRFTRTGSIVLASLAYCATPPNLEAGDLHPPCRPECIGWVSCQRGPDLASVNRGGCPMDAVDEATRLTKKDARRFANQAKGAIKDSMSRMRFLESIPAELQTPIPRQRTPEEEQKLRIVREANSLAAYAVIAYGADSDEARFRNDVADLQLNQLDALRHAQMKSV